MITTKPRPKLVNLAQKWVLDSGRTLEEVRAEYDGSCIDFSGNFLDAFGRGRLAYFNDIGHPKWRYHAAAEIDGMIHDLWIDKVMTVNRFVTYALQGGWVDYPAEKTEEEQKN